jgi:hypothetical protein
MTVTFAGAGERTKKTTGPEPLRSGYIIASS